MAITNLPRQNARFLLIFVRGQKLKAYRDTPILRYPPTTRGYRNFIKDDRNMKIGIFDKAVFASGLLALVIAYCPAAIAQAGPVPEGYTEQTFGEPAALPGGGNITVSSYEADIALSRTNQFGDVVDTVSTLVNARICAGSTGLSNMASEVYFSLARVISTGHESIPGTSPQGLRDPGLQPDYVPMSLNPGECREGWVAFTRLGEAGEKVLEGASMIWFDPAVLGMVPPDQQVKLAWRLPPE